MEEKWSHCLGPVTSCLPDPERRWLLEAGENPSSYKPLVTALCHQLLTYPGAGSISLGSWFLCWWGAKPARTGVHTPSAPRGRAPCTLLTALDQHTGLPKLGPLGLERSPLSHPLAQAPAGGASLGEPLFSGQHGTGLSAEARGRDSDWQCSMRGLGAGASCSRRKDRKPRSSWNGRSHSCLQQARSSVLTSPLQTAETRPLGLCHGKRVTDPAGRPARAVGAPGRGPQTAKPHPHLPQFRILATLFLRRKELARLILKEL